MEINYLEPNFSFVKFLIEFISDNSEDFFVNPVKNFFNFSILKFFAFPFYLVYIPIWLVLLFISFLAMLILDLVYLLFIYFFNLLYFLIYIFIETLSFLLKVTRFVLLVLTSTFFCLIPLINILWVFYAFKKAETGSSELYDFSARLQLVFVGVVTIVQLGLIYYYFF
jgi:hypothetical protein